MTKTTEKQEFVIKWVMIEDGIIKFEEKDDTYDLADHVQSFLSNSGKEESSFSGQTAEVSINENKVEFLKVKESKTIKNKMDEKPEEKVEATNDDVEEREVTVKGVSIKNRGIVFAEEKDVWYTIDENLEPQDVKKLQGTRVSIAVRKTDQGNDIVTAIKVVDNQPSEPKNKFDTVSTNSSTQKSIEAQVAVEHAQNFVSTCLANNSATLADLDADTIQQAIEKRAIENYKLIQKLKEL